MKIQFTKMSGGGNDFVVIDNRAGALSHDLPVLAKKLCDRKRGIGADGLLVLASDPTLSFRMRYLNADGSSAAMCGNGARCIARFANLLGVAPNTMNFITDAGPVTAVVWQEGVEVTMMAPTGFRKDLSVKAAGKTWKADFISVGVPHAVITVPDIQKVNVEEAGRSIRFNRLFKPKGTNVNFVQIKNRKTLLVRTYERGVEGETLACGTGVTASAAVLGLRGKVSPPVTCHTAGGDALKIAYVLEAGKISGVRLSGPTQIHFHGEVEV